MTKRNWTKLDGNYSLSPRLSMRWFTVVVAMLWLLGRFYYFERRSWSLPLEKMELDRLGHFPIAISALVAFDQYQYNKTNECALYDKRQKPCMLMHTGC